MDSLGGGIPVYVKKPYSVFNQKKHEKLEAMTLSIKFAKRILLFYLSIERHHMILGKSFFLMNCQKQ